VYYLDVKEDERVVNLTSAEKLRIILKRRGMTIGDLAEKIGKSRQNLTNQFGRDNFQENELKKIAAELGCTVDIRFTLEDTGEII